MYRYLPLVLFLGIVLWQCDSTKENKTTYHPHKLDTVPYSESVQVGDMLYISGQIANVDDDYNKIVDGGIRPQVNQTMINIQNILKKQMQPWTMLSNVLAFLQMAMIGDQ